MDVLIIGAGPIGIACALECKKKGLRYIVVEKGALTNSIFNYPLNMTFFSTSEKLEIDGIPFISNNPKPTSNEALEYYRRVAVSNRLQINLYEKILSVEKQGNYFKVTSNKKNYSTKNLIVCTGFYDIPNLLHIPGEALPKVMHYYKEAHPFIMQKVAVVGASNSAVDAALEIYRKAGEVTMIIKGATIGERVKYWVRPDIENRIKEGSIKAYFNSEIVEIKDEAITIKTPNGLELLKNDFVIALTGYKPHFKFLENLGITLSQDAGKSPYYNPSTMETNVKGIYLGGVICGGLETHKWFIENSREHAKLIVNHIKSKI
ncbi:YpdA family putative bacillithiol disulfide reductase [Aequorivita sp. SDUM287046]|uniref:YpdA family putative bacillithiol disulfide reductase n=1 Tax=Aequorivita aurantiaca TaxID=3053356 RepID=A0ABT8DGL6_9FLAO|nr:YpdA family putative bacillithiol disulfide reductase [Aequorivita aurantiaca]MDN3724511.1 YpdA family putative bacillithiol disulfide reductase [Aequorivita aurantiaca]